MVALHLLLHGHVLEAIAVCLGSIFYLRPGEIFALRGRQFVPPLPGMGKAHSHWTIVLHPLEDAKPGKTGNYDESIPMDLPEHRWFSKALQHVKKQTEAEGLAFPCGYFQFNQLFAKTVSQLGLQKLGVTPHCLRHAGASADAAKNSRTLQEIQKRGRWESFQSVRRYSKAGRVTELLHKLDPSQLQKAKGSWKELAARLSKL